MLGHIRLEVVQLLLSSFCSIVRGAFLLECCYFRCRNRTRNIFIVVVPEWLLLNHHNLAGSIRCDVDSSLVFGGLSLAIEERNFVVDAQLGRVYIGLQSWWVIICLVWLSNFYTLWSTRAEDERCDNLYHLFVAAGLLLLGPCLAFLVWTASHWRTLEWSIFIRALMMLLVSFGSTFL